MKKLGIITFNRACNYGAVLQAYALKHVCEGLGYETHVIDYNRGPDEGPHPVKRFKAAGNKRKAILKLARSFMSYLWDRDRWKAFKKFRADYLSETEPCESIAAVKNLGFDAYISGSDQIWNYNITGGRFDPVFFGDIPVKSARVVYAASAHDVPFPLDKEIELSEALKKTPAAFSVREKKLADYVGELTGIQYPSVLDPTLLAGRAAFEPLCRTTAKASEGPFILIYQIDSNPFSDISVKTLEKRFGCKVYTMTVPRVGDIHGRMGTAGPCEFLDLVKNAQFLVTNSFHGVAFSLLFHKQFYVYENSGVMTRIDDLLETVGLMKRKVKMTADIDTELQIDYSHVDSVLEDQRAASLAFLEDALNGKTRVEQHRDDFSLRLFRERDKRDCTGCGACMYLCPTKAICMTLDDEGFLYPEIDESACIRCGKCDRFCSFLPVSRREKGNEPEAYGVKHIDLDTRRTSRSGGAFIAFSDVVLSENGVIYGAAMMEDGSVRHIRATTCAERDRMKDAKYVQSDMNNCYERVIEDLKEGREVLFSGTPCQVAGLKTLLTEKKIKDHSLVTCDLVCHGVPSPMVWMDYLELIRKKNRAEIVKACFRDKSFGWDTHCESFLLDNGKKIVSRDYTDLFYSHVMFRPSCYNCRYANTNRVGDLTLADFWGVEKNAPQLEDANGVSLVLVNSDKGKTVFLKAANQLEIAECDVRNCLQPTLVKPSDPSPLRKEFWESYRSIGLEKSLKKYVRPVSKIQSVKRALKQVMYQLKLRPYP